MATQSHYRLSEPLSARDHIRGRRSAAISLVEYGDFECPYCRAAEPIVAGLREALGDQLSVTFRHFPMTEVHPHGQHAAEIAEAAAAQGKFWKCTTYFLQTSMRLMTPVCCSTWLSWALTPSGSDENWQAMNTLVTSRTTSRSRREATVALSAASVARWVTMTSWASSPRPFCRTVWIDTGWSTSRSINYTFTGSHVTGVTVSYGSGARGFGTIFRRSEPSFI